MDPVLAEQAEMDVTDVARRPSVEQVLAVRFDLLEHGPIDACRVGTEATLRARHLDDPATQEFRMVSCDSVDRVAFGHGNETLR